MLIPPVYLLLRTGESFKKIDDIIVNDEPFLIGYAFNEPNYKYLKWKTILSSPKFDVMALGSSRVLSFNSKMFDVSFYNAGYTISSINDFLPFLKSIPEEKYPNYLIIGLDQWMFNEAWDNLENTPPTDTWSGSFNLKPSTNTLINVWKDLLSNKYNFSHLKTNKRVERIGINSVFNNSGFRNDGSFFYGGQIEKLLRNDETANDYNYANTLDRISKGDRLFQYGEQVNKMALLELESILEFCKSKHIKVVAFLPPFADKVNSELSRMGRYQYMDSIFINSQSLFSDNTAELYDYSKLISVGSDDSETIDGFHGGEATYQKMLIRMLEAGSDLNSVSNVDQLKYNLVNRITRFEVY